MTDTSTAPAVSRLYGAALDDLGLEELRAQAADRGVDTSGLRSKADVRDAIQRADLVAAGGAAAPVVVEPAPEHDTRYRVAPGELVTALRVHYPSDAGFVPFDLGAAWTELPAGLDLETLTDSARLAGVRVENDSEV